MIHIECEQGTEAWHQARVGVITASRFRDACEKLKNGTPTLKSNLYASQVALEQITGEPCEEIFVTKQMRRGTELEPLARMEYEARTGYFVVETGVVLTDDRLFGYSTDGFIGEEGCIEIKCVASAEKLIAIWRSGDLSEYLHQIQGGLWITGRQWCDFVMYAPQLARVEKTLYIQRVARDDNFIEKMEVDLLRFATEVEEREQVLTRKVA